MKNNADHPLYNELKNKPLSNKDRLAIPMQKMKEQEAGERRHNMDEVALGYSKEEAVVEAMRCLDCKNAPCVKGCPVNIDIPGFIKKIAQHDFADAAAVIKKTNMLPAICGRVCPQETQCQARCTVGKSLGDPFRSVAIGNLERFAADYERTKAEQSVPEAAAATGKKVAIVGSGPASLSAAADLRKEGHHVVVFEAFHKPGGVMVYGIPEFRLPKDIVSREIETLKKMGVVFRTNFLVGRTGTIQSLMNKDGCNAVFIGSGAGLPRLLHVPGENLVGVFAANEFLTRANLMRAYDIGRAQTPVYNMREAAVVGGGNVAMDAARTALRMGCQKVHLIYRRTRSQAPARIEEVHHAEQEGIIFHFLRNIKEILPDGNGRVSKVVLSHYKLGDTDSRGRPRPEEIKGESSTLDVDGVIIAIGNSSNPLIQRTTPLLKVNDRGNIIVDPQCRTSMEGVYAGGDIVHGAATVILAMGEGRRAAAAINRYLKQG